jgi:hypothetical protein
MRFRRRVLLSIKLLAFLVFLIYIFSFDSNIDEYIVNRQTDESPNRLVLKSNCKCRRNERVIIEKSTSKVKIFLKNKTSSSIVFNKLLDDFYGLRFGCDLFNVLRRGASQKVLAYSLYGKQVRYYTKLKEIARQAKQLFPDWHIRVYHDDSINERVKCQLECLQDNTTLLNNVDFCNIRFIPVSYLNTVHGQFLNVEYIHAMMWRWMPLLDSFVDVFASRDTDSYLSQRELDAVNEWLESSGKVGHIMRDHPEHPFEMLGGLWVHLYIK